MYPSIRARGEILRGGSWVFDKNNAVTTGPTASTVIPPEQMEISLHWVLRRISYLA